MPFADPLRDGGNIFRAIDMLTRHGPPVAGQMGFFAVSVKRPSPCPYVIADIRQGTKAGFITIMD